MIVDVSPSFINHVSILTALYKILGYQSSNTRLWSGTPCLPSRSDIPKKEMLLLPTATTLARYASLRPFVKLRRRLSPHAELSNESATPSPAPLLLLNTLPCRE